MFNKICWFRAAGSVAGGLAAPTPSRHRWLVSSRHLLIGAGQAFLLDRLDPGWKEEVFNHPEPLEELLKNY
jgi:hypothetical protein